MKIVLALFRFFPYGGLQLDFLRIAMELARRGHRVICCTSEWRGDVPDQLEIKLLKLHSFTNHGRAAEFEKKMLRLIETERPDRLVAFNRMGGADFYFAADDCQLPAWKRKYGDFWMRFLPRLRTYLRLERAVYAPGAKTKILYIADRQKQEIAACYGTEEERFLLLPPGMNESCRRPPDADAIRQAERAELGLRNDEFLLLLVAGQFQVKGADRAIRALAHLPEKLRTPCRLLLCGDTKNQAFRDLADACGVAANMIFLEARQDIPRLMLAADLLIHPARKEAAGSVLTEAVAAGLPAICSGICGFAHFVSDSGGIVLPEPFRQEDLLQAMTRLLANPEELAERKEKVVRYAEHADFYRRAEVAADAILA